MSARSEADRIVAALLELPDAEVVGMLAEVDQMAAADPQLGLLVAVLEARSRIDPDRWQHRSIFQSLVTTLLSAAEEET